MLSVSAATAARINGDLGGRNIGKIQKANEIVKQMLKLDDARQFI